MTVNSDLCDKVIMIIHCPEIDSFVFSHLSQGWALPLADCNNCFWKHCASTLCSSILNSQFIQPLELKKLIRIWRGDGEPPLHTVVFRTTVKFESLSALSSPYEVVSQEDINSLITKKLLNPENLSMINASTIERGSSNPEEDFLVEVMKQDLIVYQDTPGKLALLIKSAGISEDDQFELYSLYLNAAHPFLRLDEKGMVDLMKKIDLMPVGSDHFRSADIANKGSVDFRQLLGFIAALNATSTPRDGPSADQRCRYVFRYYDKDRDDRLSVEEFSKMMNDIEVVKGNLNDKKALMDSLIDGFLNVTDFAKMVGSLKLRGTSALMIAPNPIQMVVNRFKSKRNTLLESISVTKNHRSVSLGSHVVLLPSEKQLNSIGVTNTRIPVTAVDQSPKSGEGTIEMTASSAEKFDLNTPVAYVLSALDHFTEIFETADNQKPNWWEPDYPEFVENVKSCCILAQNVLQKEPRLTRIDSPTYIIGDIHGKFNDIVAFRKWFWNVGLEHSLASVLFLGDYVDRGKHSVEVVTYLIAQKVRNPDKLFLLRGNHETRKVQKDFTFFNECNIKFGNCGVQLWELMNEVFDRLPLAALIDNQVFCCHGGIPMPSQCSSLDAINEINCPLPDASANKLAWALLWNDPQRIGYNYNQGKKTVEGGFARNTKRKTGYTFDSNALQWFIDRHNLSYVVRAHEIQDGFHVELNNKLITVFSSSNYRDHNRSGCVLVQKNKIRLFTINPPS